MLLGEPLFLLAFPVSGIITDRGGHGHLAGRHAVGFFGHAVIALSLQCPFWCLPRGYLDRPTGLSAAMCLLQLGRGGRLNAT